MFVRRKDAERRAARRLRRRGLSLRAIAVELDVALSSVSKWVRDIPRGPAPVPDPPPSANTAEADEEQPDLVQNKSDLVQNTADDEAMRSCSRCRQLLPATAFNRHGNGYQWWCRECFRAYFRKRGELHRDQCRAGRRRRRARNKAFIREYLRTHPCVDCRESDPDVLEFDHVGMKKDHVSRLADSGYSQAALAAEISACEVVCVNCHRRRTAERSGSRRAAADWRDEPAPLPSPVARNVIYAYTRLEASGCTDCGLKEICALDFDHVGPKQANVVWLAHSGCSLVRLIAEIEQCEVRCANCHRRRTVRERRKATRAKLKPPP
jgi:predicted transcriptional regulator